MLSLLRGRGIRKNHKKGIAAQAKERKRLEAELRQAAYNTLTPEQKMAKLEAGGFTASKQMYKLILARTKDLRKT